MNQETKCPKCGGEMREGELFINVTTYGGQLISTPLGFTTETTMGAMPQVTGDGPLWRERTGQKKGLLVKRDETQELKILGWRCLECGYIELYIHKKT